MGQLTRTTAPTMTPARRLQRAYRASRGASQSLRAVITNAKKERAERAEWLTAARLDVASGVRAWGLHDSRTAEAIRHAHAVEDAAEACAESWNRHLIAARRDAELRKQEAKEAYAATIA